MEQEAREKRRGPRALNLEGVGNGAREQVQLKL